MMPVGPPFAPMDDPLGAPQASPAALGCILATGSVQSAAPVLPGVTPRARTGPLRTQRQCHQHAPDLSQSKSETPCKSQQAWTASRPMTLQMLRSMAPGFGGPAPDILGAALDRHIMTTAQVDRKTRWLDVAVDGKTSPAAAAQPQQPQPTAQGAAAGALSPRSGAADVSLAARGLSVKSLVKMSKSASQVKASVGQRAPEANAAADADLVMKQTEVQEELWNSDECESEEETGDSAALTRCQCLSVSSTCAARHAKLAAKVSHRFLQIVAVVPWSAHWPVLSQLYALVQLLFASLAFTFFLMLCLQRPEVAQPVPSRRPCWTDLVLSSSALVALLVTGGPTGAWKLAACHKIVAARAWKDRFLNDLARASQRDLFVLGGLSFLAVGLRLAFTCVQETPQRWLAAAQLLFFTISFVLILGPLLALHRVSSGLTATIDTFTEQMLCGQAAAWGQERWRLTMAILRTLNKKVHTLLLTLHFSLILLVVVGVFEVVTAGAAVAGLVASNAVGAALILLTFVKVVNVAQCSDKAPELLGHLSSLDDAEDRRMERLLQHIVRSQAGLKVMDKRLTPTLLLKGAYALAAVMAFLVVNVLLKFPII